MPKNEIDYSNTIIYKIVCKDEKISDLYVGHTTNFIKRKYLHKNACNNLNNKLKIYNIIRENGGWENWDMIEISRYNCKDHTEAKIKEQEHYDILKATLNSCPPYVNKRKFFCKDCKIQCSSKYEYNKHIKCNKHINKNSCKFILPQTDIFTEKNATHFSCESCDFNCSKKSNYTQHLLTRKHKILTNTDNSPAENADTEKLNFICSCGKEYKHRQSLFNHKKGCNNLPNNDVDKSEITVLTNLVLDVVKQNQELSNQNQELTNKIVDICKNTTNTNISNSNVNSHNKTFNLNVFLNETCKDAMNIMDFVDSIKLQLSDLEKVGKNGYVEGISDIITSNLKALDITQRPIHCTDKKREILYIKDENKWEKEDDEKKKLRKAIKRVASKNQRLLPKFKEAHPDCIKAASKFSDQYNKMIIESMGGSGDNDLEKEDKIIKKIAKEVIVNKSIE